MENIEIDEIVRSRRRTIALIVTAEASLVVRAPLRTPLAYIRDLVNRKSAWIKRKLREVREVPEPPVKTFLNGEDFLYLGRVYKLCIADQFAPSVELKDKLYLSRRVLPEAREVLEKWYITEAKQKIIGRCLWCADMYGYRPAAVKISGARKRWGSCGARGRLNFSWRLIMAPWEVIDYLIVHELVHLDHPNHSKLFWNKVKSILPDYKMQANWLKENGRLLAI
jgi:hypothetical protein